MSLPAKSPTSMSPPVKPPTSPSATQRALSLSPGARALVRIPALALVLLAAALLAAGQARAVYTPSAVVSFEGKTLAEDAYSPAISANGEYVAFAGSVNGVSGVYRRNLQPGGKLELVAGSDSQDPALSASDAGAPSISGDGRYVSFTTSARLDPGDDQPGDTGGCTSVYVRDMSKQPGEAGAYILASALNGTTEGIAYAGGDESGCSGGGSTAADRVALGEKVGESGRREVEIAFTVAGESDLTTGRSTEITTPPAQVAVRNLTTDTTTLVSQTLSSLGATPEAVPGGAALTSLRGNHLALESGEGRELSGSTAAISADGSTVAWMGVDISMQAPTAGENNGNAEPLWRRIEEGPDAPTRRVTGGSDPLCGCEGPLNVGFKTGGLGELASSTYVVGSALDGDPLLRPAFSLEAVTPQLSANGQKVAILSNRPRTGEMSRTLEEEETTPTANAFVVNMAPGLSRAQALTQVTAWAGYHFADGASTGAIENLAISPDGNRVAFTTSRIDFPLVPPALITPALGGIPEPNLYVADLAAGTLSLVSYGYEGEPANGAVASPSFSGDGDTLAFSSSATNLVYGVYNKGNSEGHSGSVFVASEITSPTVAGVQSFSAAPAAPLVPQSWEILASAAPGPHGTMLVYVDVPGAGTLKAGAKAEVPVTVTVVAKSAKGKRARKQKRTIIAARTVASAKASATGAGTIELRLTSAAAYKALVSSHDGLYATVALSFAAKGRPTLTKDIQVTFHGTPAKPAKKEKTSSKQTKASAKKAKVGASPGGAAARGGRS
jgi:Tol biopolymer transport system component